jgi:hypothetical protein
MARLAIARWVVRSLGWLPAPLHRTLDAWSQREARKRRDRRVALKVQRHAP